MPELPDLEVFSRNLDRKIAGKKLVKINVLKGSNINVSAAALKKKLEGQKLSAVTREGKELRFVFQKDVLGVHLMLRGKLYWFEKENTHKHTLLELYFSGDQHLALTDFQRKARITLNPKKTEVPDALSKEANMKFWKQQLQSRASIKNLLLDQHIVRGIGNAYADEILWEAGISPFSRADKIPAAKVNKLAKSVRTVLKNAISMVSKAEPGIIGGEIRSFLAVHDAKKKKSPSGAAILNKTVGGRKTYYTREQELYT